MADIKITYETLFDILRRERNREELQEIDQSFYEDVIQYMRQKWSLTQRLGDKNQLAFNSEAEKARNQYTNIKKILKELYDRREKKIVLAALMSVKTNNPSSTPEHLLVEEQSLFERLIHLFDEQKKQVLDRVMLQAAAISEYETHSNTPSSAATPTVAPRAEIDVKAPPAKESTSDTASPHPDTQNIAVKFIKPVPRFAGADEQVFGPFQEGDVAALPVSIAKVLLKKGRVLTE